MADYTATVKIQGDSSSLDKSIAKTQATLKGFSGKMQSLGSSLSSLGQSLTNSITKPAAIATGALVGVATVKGFGRLVGIDTAQAKLKALGMNATTVEDVMNSALKSVKGTAYGLDEAATSAAAAVAAGIKPGKDLTKYLTLVGDSAAVSGRSMGEMGAIFGKVQTAQRAYTMELNQLADSGIPIYQWLADEAGTTTGEIREMASEGKISSEMFYAAIDKNIGGAAKIMGEESFTGILSNIGASVSRIGANFLDASGDAGGFFSQVKGLMVEFKNKLLDVEAVAAGAGVAFGQTFAGIVSYIRTGNANFKQFGSDVDQRAVSIVTSLQPIIDIVKGIAEKFASLSPKMQIGLLGGIVAAGPVLSVLGFILDKVGALGEGIIAASGRITAFGAAATKAGGAGALFKAKFAGIGAVISSPLGIALIAITAIAGGLIYAYKNSEKFRKLVGDLGGSLGRVFGQLEPTFAALSRTIGKTVSALAPMVATLINGLLPVINQVVMAVGNIVTALAPSLVAIINLISSALMAILPTVTNILSAVVSVVSGIISAVAPIVAFIAGIVAAIIGFISPIVSFIANIVASVILIIGKVLSAVTSIFSAVFSVVSSIFRKISSFIGGVISGIVWAVSSLVGAFSNIFNSIFSTTSKIMKKIGDTIGKVFAGVKSKWSDLKSFAFGVVNGIRGAFDGVVGQIKKVVNGVIGGINGAIKVINKIPGVDISPISKLALGTDNWSGGFAIINEGGRGELVNLPTGAQVVPHDISLRYAKEAARQDSNGAIDYDLLAGKIAGAVTAMAEPIKEGMKSAVNNMQVVVDRREFGRIVEGV